MPVYTTGTGQTIDGTLHAGTPGSYATGLQGSGATNGVQGNSAANALYGELTTGGAGGNRAVYGLAVDANDYGLFSSGGLGLGFASGDIWFLQRNAGIGFPHTNAGYGSVSALKVSADGETQIRSLGNGLNFMKVSGAAPGILTSLLTISEAGAANVVTGPLTVGGTAVCLQSGAGCPATASLWAQSGNNIYNANTGNVGIGTTGPGYKLEVAGDAKVTGGIAAGGYNPIATHQVTTPTFYTDQGQVGGATGGLKGPGKFNAVELCIQGDCRSSWSAIGGTSGWTDDGASVRLTTIGDNVGIGTTGPSTKLEMFGVLRVQGPAASYGGWGTGGWAVEIGRDDNYGYVGSYDRSTSTYKPLYLFSSKILLNGGGEGNVGIGTTGPGYKLEVAGDAKVTGGIAAGSYNPDPNHLVTTPTLFSARGEFINLCLQGISCIDSWSDIVSEGGGNQWVTSGNNIYNANSGNVGIGTTNPGTNKLKVQGVAEITGGLVVGGSISASGSLNMNSNNILAVGKITVGTVDPVYEINGKKYATFTSSVAGGVKEEYIGTVYIKDKSAEKGDGYERVINFDQEEEGSDLWVWRKVVDFNKNNVNVLITPYGAFAQAHYLIEGNKIILRSDRPVEISLRLIGKRFDWKNWPTLLPDQAADPSFKIK